MEVVWWGNVLVIGMIIWFCVFGVLELFVLELEDFGMYVVGCIFVVLVSDVECVLVMEFVVCFVEVLWFVVGVIDIDEVFCVEVFL